ncbi:helix-turn-helix domain-containing protein [Paenibacillus agilis]|uniref:Helix-turn-helix transcriptional regulator n=1 Tax=Paenibacillus agilis TaxID=3020863 RepID=A0A559IW38_9BACL|nr:helix-turn-helix transcriptional regulator [Paenibacillus agilis]TVX91834.1 helix-turn-helix transcriptional regulator [Paenibacillus agilis]
MNDSIFSLADMIRHHRLKLGLTLHDLAIETNLSKGAISKIENGRRKKPEYSTVKSIASVLKIPYNEYINIYIALEKNADTMFEIFKESLTIDDTRTNLVRKIMLTYLKLASDSYDAVEQIYNTAELAKNTTIKLSIYKTILDYSRSHGIMHFLARSLYQIYLVERNDFTKLRQTYESGEYVLKYVEFLPSKERLSLYYKLAVHAFTLQLHNETIKHCNVIVQEDTSHGKVEKSYAYGMLRDSYLYLGNLELAEKYSIECQKQNSSQTSDNDKLYVALLNSKKGNKELAELQFQDCLATCAESFIAYVANEYISFLLLDKETSKVEEILPELEDKINELTFATPIRRRELACFYKLQGDFHTQINNVNQALDFYMDGAYEYSQIDDIDNERECLRLMYYLYRNNKVIVDAETVDKVDRYYERFKKEGIMCEK